MSVDDATNPRHYTEITPQPIEVIEGWELNYRLGNCLKYIARAGRKPGNTRLADLQKAAWYLFREVERLKLEEKNG